MEHSPSSELTPPKVTFPDSAEYLLRTPQALSSNTPFDLNNLAPLHRATLLTALSLIGCALFALLVNTFFFHYVGHNYYPQNTLFIGLIVLVILAGTYLQFDANHVSFLMIRELFFFYLLLAALTLLTNAVQYTPFTPIDAWIVQVESRFHINHLALLSWTQAHPRLHEILLFAYQTLGYQITFLPLFMILARRWQAMRAYYFLVLISAVLGFGLYYFFPTVAPATYFHSPLFSDSQRATGIKFHEIHHYLRLSTQDGGLIALPSFHAIWAWFCLYLVSPYRLLFWLLLPLNICLTAACVLLGWHYPLDLIAAALVILMSHGIYQSIQSRTVK